MMHPATTSLAIGLLGFASVASAQSGGPDAVVLKACEELNKGRPEAYASAMHPDDLKVFRRAFMGIVAMAAKNGQADEVLTAFPGVGGIAGLQTLDDATFFAKFLSGVVLADPETRKSLASMTLIPVGSLPDPDAKDAVLVLFRARSADGESPRRVNVVPARRFAGAWKMGLNGEFEEMVRSMTLAAEGKRLPAIEPGGSRIEPIGSIVETQGDLDVAFRSVATIDGRPSSKVFVETIPKADPEFAAAVAAKGPALAEILGRRLGSSSPPKGAAESPK